MYIGNMQYGDMGRIAFQVAHLEHCDSGPHVWLMVGSGPWFDNDDRDCWVTLHLWQEDNEVKTSISDPQMSPFWASAEPKNRYLLREEVLAQPGGREWAIDRRLEFVNLHLPTDKFVNGSSEAA